MKSGHPNVVEDSVDFLKLLSIIVSFVKSAKRHLAIGSISGILLGLTWCIFSKPVYQSTMGGFSTNLSDSKVISLYEDLGKLFKQKDYDQLSILTSISVGTLKKVNDIEVKRTKLTTNIYEETEQKLGFEITAKVYDTNVLDSLEQGLKNYVENIPYVKLRLESAKSSLKFNIAKLDEEIKNMDTLKENVTDILNNKGSRNAPNLFLSDIGGLNQKLVEMYEKQKKYNEELAQIEDILIVRHFTKFKKKYSPKYSIFLPLGFLLGIFVSLVVYIYPIVNKFVQEA
ncbi:MAG TPA: hypothetical protein DCR46_02750 [Cytophagales bacterium]|nr:hypothetical protein [Cytophagales bacterium]